LTICIDDAADDMGRVLAVIRDHIDTVKSTGGSTTSIRSIETLEGLIGQWRENLISSSTRPAPNPPYRGGRTNQSPRRSVTDE
jgi:hypothetical protein